MFIKLLLDSAPRGRAVMLAVTLAMAAPAASGTDGPPVIVLEPAGESVISGATVSFEVATTGAVPLSEAYKVVQLKNGVRSVHSVAHNETMHPGLGPVAEAQGSPLTPNMNCPTATLVGKR